MFRTRLQDKFDVVLLSFIVFSMYDPYNVRQEFPSLWVLWALVSVYVVIARAASFYPYNKEPALMTYLRGLRHGGK